jgi:hypothetical protein
MPNALLTPVEVRGHVQGQAAANAVAIGILRQIKFGPNCINKISIYDNASVLQCRAISSGYNVNRQGVYFDTVA